VWRRPAPAPGGPAKPWSGPPRPGDSVVSTGDEIGPEEIWQEPASRLLKRLATNPSGLDTAEVQSLSAVHGYNTAATATRSPLWLQFLARFRNPLVVIYLIGVTVAYLALVEIAKHVFYRFIAER